MWSLPDIERLNSDARKQRNRIEHALRTKVVDGQRVACSHCELPAEYVYAYFDIFSRDPKGFFGLCAEHDHQSGSPDEGFFTCDRCSKVMVENYTWECYFRDDPETGDRVCLPCALATELADPTNWIRLTPERIESITFKEVRRAKHLIGVRMPIPRSITLLGNVELDGATGGRLTSFSSCERTPDGGVEDIMTILEGAQAQGVRRAILIIDGTYQFSVSMGVYIDTPKRLLPIN